MQVLNNFSPLPFYEDTALQSRHAWYAYGEQYINWAPKDVLLPFYIIVPKDFSELFWSNIEIKFYDCCGNEVGGTGGGSFSYSFNESFEINPASVTPNKYASRMAMNGIKIVKGEAYDTLIYYALHNQSISLPNGSYYIRIKFTMASGTSEFYAYSDIFTVSDTQSKVVVSWRNEESLLYKGGFVPFGIKFADIYDYHHELYLDTEIGLPNYNFTEEGDERNGYFYPTRQISEKAYSMHIIAPEYICDALRLVRMADYATVKQTFSPNHERIFTLGQFEADVEWLEQGYYADVQCTFKTDTIVKKTGKAYIIE